MKKFTKVVVITALIIGILGAVLFAVGIARGASVRDFQEAAQVNPMIRRWVYRWNGYDIDDTDRDEVTLNTHHGDSQDIVLEAEKAESLSVEAAAGSVRIKTVSGNEIRISGVHASDSVDLETEDKELCISREHKRGVHKNTMVIEIPQDKTFRELDIDVSAGDVKTTGKLAANECSLSVDAGNLEIELLDSRETEMECNAGNMAIKCAGKAADYSVWAECSMGSMKLDGKEYKGVAESGLLEGGSGRTIEIEANVSNLVIEFEN